VNETLFDALSREDWQGLYNHLGTMPWASGSWSNHWREILSEALAINSDVLSKSTPNGDAR
jgi:hypothetical protein